MRHCVVCDNDYYTILFYIKCGFEVLYCSNDEDDIRYFYYVFANKAFQSSLLGIGNGILMKESENGTFNTIRMRIPIEKLNNMSIRYPKPEIQKAIANFLDKKIGKIDEVSKKIQQEITDLEKYRKSIITKAVTTGLNKNIQMKDSNIDYINKLFFGDCCAAISFYFNFKYFY